MRGPLAGSSNGRTPDSGSGSLGSNPSPAASTKAPQARGFLPEPGSGVVTPEICTNIQLTHVASGETVARAARRGELRGVSAHDQPVHEGVRLGRGRCGPG